jgi:hypothetical protein
MQYLASLLALAAAVVAQTAGFDAITSPGQGATLNKGDDFVITWEFNAQWPGTCKIVLIGGATQPTQQPIETITPSVDNSAGSFKWTVDTSGLAVYGFQIIYNDDNSVFQYSFPFNISSSGGSTVTTGSSMGGAGTYGSLYPTTTTSTTSTGGSGYVSPTGSSGYVSPTGGSGYVSPTGNYGYGNSSYTAPTSSYDTETTIATSTTYTPTSAPTTAGTAVHAGAAAAATAFAGGVAMLGGLAMAVLAL